MSTLNCKPGDIAQCVADGVFLGAQFRVMHQAVGDEVVLPDGVINTGGKSTTYKWVLEYLGPSLKAKWPEAISDRYGVGADYCLRPLPPLSDDESTPAFKNYEVPA